MLRFPLRALGLALTFGCLTALAACAAGTSATGMFTGGAGGGSSSSSSGTGAGDVGGGSFTSSSSGSSSGTGGSAPEFAAYAHSGKSLYTIDPKAPSAAPKLVGDFDCIGGAGQDSAMTDLAVDSAGEVWGISNTKFYRLAIQNGVVHCASTFNLPAGSETYYGLTFAPAGTLDPTKETLIASDTAGELWKIDTTGVKAPEQHGTFGKVPANDGHGHAYQNAGMPWELSGDIVFLANGGAPVGFATVRDCPNPPDPAGCNATDTLIEIDMSKLKTIGTQSVTLKVRGQVVAGAGCAGGDTAYQRMLGIAAWNAKVYGFSHNAAIVEIDNNDGTACQVVSTPGVFWNGAGVTTLAPVIPPPPN